MWHFHSSRFFVSSVCLRSGATSDLSCDCACVINILKVRVRATTTPHQHACDLSHLSAQVSGVDFYEKEKSVKVAASVKVSKFKCFLTQSEIMCAPQPAICIISIHVVCARYVYLQWYDDVFFFVSYCWLWYGRLSRAQAINAEMRNVNKANLGRRLSAHRIFVSGGISYEISPPDGGRYNVGS